MIRVAVCLVSGCCVWLVGCGPKKPPEGPPPEYEPGRAWTPDGKPVPRGSAAPPVSTPPVSAPRQGAEG